MANPFKPYEFYPHPAAEVRDSILTSWSRFIEAWGAQPWTTLQRTATLGVWIRACGMENVGTDSFSRTVRCSLRVAIGDVMAADMDGRVLIRGTCSRGTAWELRIPAGLRTWALQRNVREHIEVLGDLTFIIYTGNGRSILPSARCPLRLDVDAVGHSGGARPGLALPEARATASLSAPLPERWLDTSVALRPELARALGLEGRRDTRAAHPILYAEVSLTARATPVDLGVQTPVLIALKATCIMSPIPEDVAVAAWRHFPGPLPLAGEGPDDARRGSRPAWLNHEGGPRVVRLLLRRHLTSQSSLTLPWSPELRIAGGAGETLAQFRDRIVPLIEARSSKSVGLASDALDSQSRYFEREVATMKELLEMDRRELAMLREGGDLEALAKAEIRIRSRMERYKALLAKRDSFLGDARGSRTQAELDGLLAVKGLCLQPFALEYQDISCDWCGVLWVPGGRGG
jgi:hypothetical protein